MLTLRIGGSFLTGALVLVLATLPVAAQTDPVTYHDFSAMPSNPLGKMQVKAVIGESSSVAIAELPPGMRQTPHYHEQEQIVLGLGGPIEIAIGGTPHRLGSSGATIPPSNTEHALINGDAGIGKILEFQPMRRPDWLPPYPKVPLTKGSEPVAVSPDQRVFTDFATASADWRVETNGARSKVLSGQTIRVTMWDLSTAKASVDLTSQVSRSERFVYVLEGQAEIAVGSDGSTEVRRQKLPPS